MALKYATGGGYWKFVLYQDVIGSSLTPLFVEDEWMM
jgi:hypothetical protein